MQAVHMPEVAALRAAVAASGADEGALADAVASGGAMAAALPAAWRSVALERLQVVVALPELQADGREVLGLLASAPELAQEHEEADTVCHPGHLQHPSTQFRLGDLVGQKSVRLA